MKRAKRSRMYSLVIFCVLGLRPQAGAGEAPGGRFVGFDPPGSTITKPSGINILGTITGGFADAEGQGHGFIRYTSGKIIQIDVPGKLSTFPSAILPDNTITGTYNDSSGVHGFLRTPDGGFTTYSVPRNNELVGRWSPAGPPPGISLTGEIVGTYDFFKPTFVEHGFMRIPDGTITTIDVPGALNTEVLGISPAGTIIGDYAITRKPDIGFILRDGKITSIRGPCRGGTPPTAINVFGEITGYCQHADDSFHGYVYAPGGKVLPFDPPGSIFTSPFAISAMGVIAGYYVGNGVHGFFRTPWGAFCSVDVPGAAQTFIYEMNDLAAVVGSYAYENNVFHGYVRYPSGGLTWVNPCQSASQ